MKNQNEESEIENSNDKLKENNLYIKVSVSDSGCGMNEEIKKKCFVLFGNLKIKRDINQGGMGLGLASSNLIC
jgi:signal transduction histidine kinase